MLNSLISFLPITGLVVADFFRGLGKEAIEGGRFFGEGGVAAVEIDL